MQDVTILHTGARISDKDTLERLLASIPEPDQVRPRLGTKFELWLYQASARREVWIVSDGEVINAYTVLDVTPQESLYIRETREGYPDLDIDTTGHGVSCFGGAWVSLPFIGRAG